MKGLGWEMVEGDWPREWTACFRWKQKGAEARLVSLQRRFRHWMCDCYENEVMSTTGRVGGCALVCPNGVGVTVYMRDRGGRLVGEWGKESKTDLLLGCGAREAAVVMAVAHWSRCGKRQKWGPRGRPLWHLHDPLAGMEMSWLVR